MHKSVINKKKERKIFMSLTKIESKIHVFIISLWYHNHNYDTAFC